MLIRWRRVKLPLFCPPHVRFEDQIMMFRGDNRCCRLKSGIGCVRKSIYFLCFSSIFGTILYYYLVERSVDYGNLDNSVYISLIWKWDSSQSPVNKLAEPLHTREHANYLVVYDYIAADKFYLGNSSVTLTTQGTYEFLHHVEQLCLRWKAPASIAVYAPGRDFYPAVRRILYLRRCRHPCLKANVTWHLIVDKAHAPTREDTLKAREMPVNCQNDTFNFINFRETHKLSYPINLARNVARKMARTHYVLASDIELYPSLDLVPRFLDMVLEHNVSSLRVYVLPVFEVEENSKVPDTKKELLEMMSSKKAVFFHKLVCDACHKFPDRDRWLKTAPPEDSMTIFSTVKHAPPWEPFYIGTNNEPPFHENFTWEGKMNKFPQVLEMCFMDYDFCILDNAFLVHSPGIKRIDRASERRRAPYAVNNTKLYRLLRRDLTRKYRPRFNCMK
ncbi:beta-1,4-glucuronyltransferase 1-like [Centruroides sculpturatus]|uniref:beta-1,4-glucuronyltransferase 1-like n=1 Tax=Centruroides sculpturatus TaxID=218467 RepID=UPI000C6DCC1A|nr:beta-1,4-glucuronyltransferase 1-like [Centruroides sculpturatus]